MLRNRLISSTLTAAASRLSHRWAGRFSILQSLNPPTLEHSRQEFDRGRLGRNHFESWSHFVDVEKSEHNPFKNADASAHSDFAKSLIRLGSRTELCPTPWCLTLASAGVTSISFLRNLVVYLSERICPSRCFRGRIAPVMHHRRPHNIPWLISRRTIVKIVGSGCSKRRGWDSNPRCP